MNVKHPPIAQQIADLVESVGGGSQRAFARLVGCSQPVISRVINGQQRPGRDLVERIAQLDGVDREALLASLDEPLPHDRSDDSVVPIADSLLRSVPTQELFSASTVAVSKKVFRPTLYAVRARACEPAYSDPAERLRADDLIILDSSTDHLSENLQRLNGKLCVVDGGDTLTLRRVWTKYDHGRGKWALHTCADARVDDYRNKKYGGKLLRTIQLDLPEDAPDEKFINDELNVDAVVGIAIQLMRSL